MRPNRNKYPGFIDGLKASNISLNRTSLYEYSEQILSNIQFLLNSGIVIPMILLDNLKRSEETIKNSLNIESTAEEIINIYIKFGDIYNSILPELKLYSDINVLKEIAVNYLQIAKYSTDSRIKILSISIAKYFE